MSKYTKGDVRRVVAYLNRVRKAENIKIVVSAPIYGEPMRTKEYNWAVQFKKGASNHDFDDNPIFDPIRDMMKQEYEFQVRRWYSAQKARYKEINDYHIFRKELTIVTRTWERLESRIEYYTNELKKIKAPDKDARYLRITSKKERRIAKLEKDIRTGSKIYRSAWKAILGRVRASLERFQKRNDPLTVYAKKTYPLVKKLSKVKADLKVSKERMAPKISFMDGISDQDKKDYKLYYPEFYAIEKKVAENYAKHKETKKARRKQDYEKHDIIVQRMYSNTDFCKLYNDANGQDKSRIYHIWHENDGYKPNEYQILVYDQTGKYGRRGRDAVKKSARRIRQEEQNARQNKVVERQRAEAKEKASPAGQEKERKNLERKIADCHKIIADPRSSSRSVTHYTGVLKKAESDLKRVETNIAEMLK